MAQWLVAVSAARYQAERLYERSRLELPLPAGHPLSVGEDLVLVAQSDAPVVFGLARVVADPGGDGPRTVLAEYRQRLIDRPVPAGDLDCATVARQAAAALGDADAAGAEADAPVGAVPISPAEFQRVAVATRPVPVARRDWMVSLDLPIEASSPAEAVRIFWDYVRTLGPSELPAFVWPRGDELAMRPYVLGSEHEMDPEED